MAPARLIGGDTQRGQPGERNIHADDHTRLPKLFVHGARPFRSFGGRPCEQLGYGCENGTWRNFYLTGTLELRHGNVGTPTVAASPDMLAALTLSQILDSWAIRVDGPACWDAQITIQFLLDDDKRQLLVQLRNGVLVHLEGTGPAGTEPDVQISLAEPDLRALLLGTASLDELAEVGRAHVAGDAGKLAELAGHLAEPDPGFAIVTP